MVSVYQTEDKQQLCRLPGDAHRYVILSALQFQHAICESIGGQNTKNARTLKKNIFGQG